jgi:hypothetical protein
MAIRSKDGPLVGMQQDRPGAAPACEVCRKLKVRQNYWCSTQEKANDILDAMHSTCGAK